MLGEIFFIVELQISRHNTLNTFILSNFCSFRINFQREPIQIIIIIIVYKLNICERLYVIFNQGLRDGFRLKEQK